MVTVGDAAARTTGAAARRLRRTEMDFMVRQIGELAGVLVCSESDALDLGGEQLEPSAGHNPSIYFSLHTHDVNFPRDKESCIYMCLLGRHYLTWPGDQFFLIVY